MIDLIIKGTPEEARAALDARKLLTTSALDPRPSLGVTRATVHRSDLDDVAAWFISGPPAPPFKPGTLLLYSRREDT